MKKYGILVFEDSGLLELVSRWIQSNRNKFYFHCADFQFQDLVFSYLKTQGF